MSEWYFAYGSNLSIDKMIERTGAVDQRDDRPRLARLPNYRLVFNVHHRGQVFANIHSPGKGVLGVLYCCSPAALNKLDNYETGYERQRVMVVTENGDKLEAFAYIASSTNAAISGKPSPEYLHKIISGARQHGLPETYVEEIEAIASANGA